MDVRIGALKKFAHIWSAIGHYNYEYMVARHLVDVEKWPTSLQTIMKEGGFSVNLKPGKLNGVGIDEAHEMESSKTFSSTIVRVTDDACLKAASTD